jgi:hypothetical protein
MLRLQALSLPHHQEVWAVCRHRATLLHRQASSPPELLTHHSILKHQSNKRLLQLQGHHREDRHRDHHVLVPHQVDLLADHPVLIRGQVLDSR